MNFQPKASMRIHSESETEGRGMNWRLIALQGILGLMALIVVTVIGVQSAETKNLRNAAGKIQPGDNMAKVSALLGGSTHGYECGWPSAGAPPTKF